MKIILILFFSHNDTPPFDDKADLCLIKVDEPFVLNEWVAPVRLPKWNFTRDYSKHCIVFIVLGLLFLSLESVSCFVHH